jgi:hypothetical protein
MSQNFSTRLLGAVEAAAPSPVKAVVKADSQAAAATSPAQITKIMERFRGKMRTSVVPGLVVGTVGAVAWKKHRVLGFLAGDALGMNAYDIAKGSKTERISAVCNLGVTGAAVAASLNWHKHPFWGYVLGSIGASIVTSFVPGNRPMGSSEA